MKNGITKNRLISAAAAAILVAGAGSFYLWRGEKTAVVSQVETYYCPMHPDYISHSPGQCPICHMDLVKAEEKNVGDAAVSGKKVKFYRNPMNPDVTSPVPAKDEMGMEYIPVYEESGISISEQAKNLIGVKIGYAKMREISPLLSLPGRIAYDPKTYDAIEEYRQLFNALSMTSAGKSYTQEREALQRLLKAAETKLLQLGFPAEELVEIPGKDYSSLLVGGRSAWGYFYVQEEFLAGIKKGMIAKIKLQSHPEKTLTGEIKFVDRIISADTRLAKIRMEIDGEGVDLLPEMFAQAQLKISLGRKLSVPSDSFINLAGKSIIYVVKEGGEFERRNIRTGVSDGKYTEVISGLSPGEKIVVSSNFLIDSEAKLKGD